MVMVRKEMVCALISGRVWLMLVANTCTFLFRVYVPSSISRESNLREPDSGAMVVYRSRLMYSA